MVAPTQLLFALSFATATLALVAPPGPGAARAAGVARASTLNLGDMLKQVTGSMGGGSKGAKSAGEKLAALLGGAEGIDAAKVAEACSADIVYEDMASTSYDGPAATRQARTGQARAPARRRQQLPIPPLLVADLRYDDTYRRH